MDEGLGKGIPGRGNSLGRSVEALGSCGHSAGQWPSTPRSAGTREAALAFFLAGGLPRTSGELCLRFLLSEVTEPPKSISGMWRPDSLSSLSSQSEVHKTAFPFSHSYSNIGSHASQMELAGGIQGHIFCLGCESR